MPKRHTNDIDLRFFNQFLEENMEYLYKAPLTENKHCQTWFEEKKEEKTEYNSKEQLLLMEQ